MEINIGNIIGENIVINGKKVIANGKNVKIVNGKIVEGDCIEGKGEKVDRKFEISNIKKLKVDDGIDVIVSFMKDKQNVLVNTFENIIDLIDVKQENDTLSISLKECVINPEIAVVVSIETLNEFYVSGASSVKVIPHKDIPIPNKLFVNLSGASDFSILWNMAKQPAISEYLELNMSGASSFSVI